MKPENFTDILILPIGPTRTAALAKWVQGLYRSNAQKPVLVGGSAVELFTGGAYVTGDLDFAGLVPSYVHKALTKFHFVRQGRHWIHEEGRIFLEFPSTTLAPGERSESRTFGSHSILIVSPEDLVVDRLSAWVHWRSAVDGVNAYLLYRALHEEMDIDRLEQRCLEADVSEALDAVRHLFEENKGELPASEKLEEWAAKV